MIPYKQLSLADIFENCQNIFEEDKPQFLSLLEQHIDLSEYIPLTFYNHFYASTGRTRTYPLTAFIWALIIQKIFSIPTDQLLLIFLQYSKPLRDFCGFRKVPDASKITRFKQDFLPDLQSVFDNLVDITEPICQAIDAAKADMTIFDSSGIEAFVWENNPKYADRIICHISFYNKDFLAQHPEIIVNKKSDSPDEDKSVHDSRLLIPTLTDFFQKHPLINPKTFLGDAAFDTTEIYKKLLTDDTFGTGKHFPKAYIPLNARSHLENKDYTVNYNGIPYCPHDPSLPMKPEGNTSHLHFDILSLKFVCPKMKWRWDKTKKSYRECQCNNPCTDSKCGRMVYVYPEKDLRAYPGAVRSTEERDETYKIRTTVERSINHVKDTFGLAHRRTQNEKTLCIEKLCISPNKYF